MSKLLKNITHEHHNLFGTSTITLKRINAGVGIIFVSMALIGFWGVNLWGLHLHGAHNFIHLITGLLALWFASMVSSRPIYVFSVSLGLTYLLLSIGGFLFGQPQNNIANDLAMDPFYLHLSSFLTLGKSDHIFHAIIAFVLLISANTHSHFRPELQADNKDI